MLLQSFFNNLDKLHLEIQKDDLELQLYLKKQILIIQQNQNQQGLTTLDTNQTSIQPTPQSTTQSLQNQINWLKISQSFGQTNKNEQIQSKFINREYCFTVKTSIFTIKFSQKFDFAQKNDQDSESFNLGPAWVVLKDTSKELSLSFYLNQEFMNQIFPKNQPKNQSIEQKQSQERIDCVLKEAELKAKKNGFKLSGKVDINLNIELIKNPQTQKIYFKLINEQHSFQANLKFQTGLCFKGQLDEHFNCQEGIYQGFNPAQSLRADLLIPNLSKNEKMKKYLFTYYDKTSKLEVKFSNNHLVLSNQNSNQDQNNNDLLGLFDLNGQNYEIKIKTLDHLQQGQNVTVKAGLKHGKLNGLCQFFYNNNKFLIKAYFKNEICTQKAFLYDLKGEQGQSYLNQNQNQNQKQENNNSQFYKLSRIDKAYFQDLLMTHASKLFASQQDLNISELSIYVVLDDLLFSVFQNKSQNKNEKTSVVIDETLLGKQYLKTFALDQLNNYKKVVFLMTRKLEVLLNKTYEETSENKDFIQMKKAFFEFKSRIPLEKSQFISYFNELKDISQYLLEQNFEQDINLISSQLKFDFSQNQVDQDQQTSFKARISHLVLPNTMLPYLRTSSPLLFNILCSQNILVIANCIHHRDYYDMPISFDLTMNQIQGINNLNDKLKFLKAAHEYLKLNQNQNQKEICKIKIKNIANFLHHNYVYNQHLYAKNVSTDRFPFRFYYLNPLSLSDQVAANTLKIWLKVTDYQINHRYKNTKEACDIVDWFSRNYSNIYLDPTEKVKIAAFRSLFGAYCATICSNLNLYLNSQNDPKNENQKKNLHEIFGFFEPRHQLKLDSAYQILAKKILDLKSQDKIPKDFTLQEMKQLQVQQENLVSLKEEDLKHMSYPLIIKTEAANGVYNSHFMGICKTFKGVQIALQGPYKEDNVIIQEYANHNESIVKILKFGSECELELTSGMPNELIRDPDADIIDAMKIKSYDVKLDQEMLQVLGQFHLELINVYQLQFDLTTISIDIIRKEGTNQYFVIDVNNMSSFRGIPDFRDALVNYVGSLFD